MFLCSTAHARAVQHSVWTFGLQTRPAMPGREWKRRRIEVSPVADGVGGEAQFGVFLEVKKQLLARLLYANPVCLLASRRRQPSLPVDDGHSVPTAPGEESAVAGVAGEPAGINVMTISWLTCIDNRGTFFASMNEGRATANILGFSDGLYEGCTFSLNVPVAGAESLLKRIGGESGRDVDKAAALGLRFTSAGAGGALEASDAAPCVDHPLVVAHLTCRVLSGCLQHGHHLLTCVIDAGFVRKQYWSGDVFAPRAPVHPPYLSFYGSGRFAYAAPSWSPPVAVDCSGDAPAAAAAALPEPTRPKLDGEAPCLDVAGRSADDAD